MKYMLLLYADESGFARLSEKEQGEMMGAYHAYTQALTNAGALISSNRLQLVRTATTVRAANKVFQVMDGPFAEAKEQLGGYYLIEAADLDAALKWAKQCPGAQHGTVEVRPIWEMQNRS